jgi:hypothetical protein
MDYSFIRFDSIVVVLLFSVNLKKMGFAVEPLLIASFMPLLMV